MAIRVVVIEDECLIRDGIKQWIGRLPEVEVVAAVGSLAEAIPLVKREEPDLIFLDLVLQDGEGFDLFDSVNLREIDCKCIAVSVHQDSYTLFRIRQSPIQGFLDKRIEGLDRLPEALDRVMAGDAYFSPSVRESFGNILGDPEAFYKILSPRELKVLPLLGQGLNNLEVAEELGLAETTVQGHRRNIMRKLGLNRSSQLVCYAVAGGFIRQSHLQVQEEDRKKKR